MASQTVEEAAAHRVLVFEVVDPPSLPETPVSPNRILISMAGGVGGLILGLAVARFTRR